MLFSPLSFSEVVQQHKCFLLTLPLMLQRIYDKRMAQGSKLDAICQEEDLYPLPPPTEDGL